MPSAFASLKPPEPRFDESAPVKPLSLGDRAEEPAASTSLGQPFPLRPGVGSLEEWIDLSA